jgi:CDP-diacylglycerol---glycerol-3-phosphate 3-phosphatidyltransferase
MISVYQIKPKFQQLLRPLTKGLYKAGITPNMLTVSAVFLSAFLGFTIYLYQFNPLWILAVPMGLLLRMVLNALDGMMAKEFNQSSSLGMVLNELGDIVSDIVIYVPLLFLPGAHLLVVLGFAFSAAINETAGILGVVISKTRRYDGPMGKSDRALVIGILCLLYYLDAKPETYINYVLGAAILLITISTAVRIKKAL